MALSVVLLDMLKVRRFLERRNIPIKVLLPLIDSRVTRADIANIALEVLDVDRIEPDYRHEETNIGFGETVAQEVWTGGLHEELFDAIE